MIKLRIKRNPMLMQQGCQSLSAKVSIMVHWMPLQRVKITEKEGIILDCTLHLESTLQQVIINGSCQSGCPNCSFFLRQKFEQLSLLQLSESKRWACRASVIYKSRLHWCGKSERFFKFHIFLDSFHAVQPLKKVTLQVKSHKKNCDVNDQKRSATRSPIYVLHWMQRSFHLRLHGPPQGAVDGLTIDSIWYTTRQI